ncbi:MAG: hypothetical protein R3C58_10085 [Parvularculaceae bacterium]
MGRFILIFILLIFSAAPVAAKTDREKEYAAETAEAERLGRIIYDYDIAAWVATDLLVERIGALDGKVSGWIVEKADGGERVLFYRGSNGLFAPGYSIDVRKGKAVGASFAAYPADAALTPAQATMIKAREAGLKAGASGCSPSYNTVVIPDETIGYLVYILAATTDPNAVQIGGHLRHDIDAAGENVVGFRKFTNSCIALSKVAPDGKSIVVALLVSQVLTAYPTEIHVWASLLHDIDLFVVTGEKALWKVSGGQITDESSILRASFGDGAFEPPAPDWSVLRINEVGHFVEPGFFEN